MNNNLNLFRIFYIIKGILNLIFTLFFAAYVLIGTYIMNLGFHEHDNAMWFNPGWIFMIIGSIGAFFSLILGLVTLLAAKYLKDIKNYNFILVVAILNCLTGVLGILLGVFTIIELNKPEVKTLFNSQK